MQIPVSIGGSGLHPNEKVVSVETRDGVEELVVDQRSLNGNMLEIGWPVGQNQDHYLVELPQETFRGFWRVWVPRSAVVEIPPERKRA